MGDKITRWRGDVKERRAGTGFRPFSVWATKSPGGESGEEAAGRRGSREGKERREEGEEERREEVE